MKLLRRFATAAQVALILASLSVPNAHAVTIDMVTVGNPMNAHDTNGYGAVAEPYMIGKHLVTIGQYTDFLNAAAKSDPFSLYNTNMASDFNIAGISRSGTSGAYSYSTIAPYGSTPPGASSSGNRPITYVTWFSAARFANWMQNGQGSGSTETGAYTLGGATSGDAVAKNLGATFYIPTENEWYKAAFFSPDKGGAGSPGYYAYATQSDTTPGNTIGSGTNQANYMNIVYSVTGSTSETNSQNYLTDVGAFSGSASYYGTFDQSGNSYEWNDLDGLPSSSRGLRGGFWNNIDAVNLSSSYRLTGGPSDYFVGFRLASPVPEPTTLGMASGGALCACGWWVLKRRRRART